jgi:hypothetical protein
LKIPELLESCQFQLRHGWFNFREQFSDIPSSLAANLLVPFFVWILSRVWERFNLAQGNFTLSEIVIYVGITEVLFMTFVRGQNVSRASGDFSIALARPRSWIATSLSGLIGRSLGARIFMLLIILGAFPFLGSNFSDGVQAMLRLLILLPWLAVMQGLFALFFAIAQVLWHQTNYFLLPFGKIFLVLGGVWGPIADFSQPWKDWLLLLPPSDLFFQPAYFCIKGQFYGMSPGLWLLKTLALALTLSFVNATFFRLAKTRHQSFGG